MLITLGGGGGAKDEVSITIKDIRLSQNYL